MLGWQAPPQVSGSPIVGGQTVYSLDLQGTLYALDSSSGAVRVSIPVGTTTRFATPSLIGDQLFVGTRTGIVAITIA
jgi:outer membrane protein assembly factor BamB